jgi:hypothetical protein
MTFAVIVKLLWHFGAKRRLYVILPLSFVQIPVSDEDATEVTE